MIPYFQALFIQRHSMISALMIYGPKTYGPGNEKNGTIVHVYIKVLTIWNLISA